MPCELVQENRDAVYGAASLEMRLDFFGGSAVVHVANKDASRIDVFPVFAYVGAVIVEVVLHIAQFLRFFLHLLYAAFHSVELLLNSCVSSRRIEYGSSDQVEITWKTRKAALASVGNRVRGPAYLIMLDVLIASGVQTLILFAAVLSLNVGHFLRRVMEALVSDISDIASRAARAHIYKAIAYLQ
jgi:hypothetical protein